ncbi:hypothetical protein TEA_021634 [Camellia sinensis var. sinensis]|uniref:Uncharacterized protein n=1 Tax=Camellia sinensis var. sinensis TaxID=542762 RepID=A0A4V3WPB0_CAMSN|nr:hypothetical protein TEA_021634 [Camellia sinensis var. sinensis]
MNAKNNAEEDREEDKQESSTLQIGGSDSLGPRDLFRLVTTIMDVEETHMDYGCAGRMATNDSLRLASLWHSMHAISQQLLPMVGCLGIELLQVDNFNLHCFQSLTEIKSYLPDAKLEVVDPRPTLSHSRVGTLVRSVELYIPEPPTHVGAPSSSPLRAPPRPSRSHRLRLRTSVLEVSTDLDREEKPQFSGEWSPDNRELIGGKQIKHGGDGLLHGIHGKIRNALGNNKSVKRFDLLKHVKDNKEFLIEIKLLSIDEVVGDFVTVNAKDEATDNMMFLGGEGEDEGVDKEQQRGFVRDFVGFANLIFEISDSVIAGCGSGSTAAVRRWRSGGAMPTAVSRRLLAMTMRRGGG